MSWKRDLRRAFGSTAVGFFGGLLLAFVSLNALGAFELRVEKLILIPVAVTQPTRTATPAPTATPTEEQLFEKRRDFDNRDLIDPKNQAPKTKEL